MSKNQAIAPRMEKDIHELRALVLTMAGYVEESVDTSMKALVLRDKSLLEQILRIEVEVNSLHKKIDGVCFRILACQSPVASYLRLVFAIIKINVDLERMGDLVRNNSFAIEDYLQSSPNLIVQQIREMATTVTHMIRNGFDAFMESDFSSAHRVLSLDDSVDQFRNRLSEELREHLQNPVGDFQSTMALLSVIRNLERLADHATNIAEEVIFFLTGSDIRHRYDLEFKQGGKE
ncbi:phosphate signaling complex protein PhoU [bacterium]|nr:phosphate signaling complex protein PhoU [bacterium]